MMWKPRLPRLLTLLSAALPRSNTRPIRGSAQMRFCRLCGRSWAALNRSLTLYLLWRPANETYIHAPTGCRFRSIAERRAGGLGRRNAVQPRMALPAQTALVCHIPGDRRDLFLAKATLPQGV